MNNEVKEIGSRYYNKEKIEVSPGQLGYDIGFLIGTITKLEQEAMVIQSRIVQIEIVADELYRGSWFFNTMSRNNVVKTLRECLNFIKTGVTP